MSLAQKEAVGLAVCTDCVMLIANGEITDGEGNDVTQAHARTMSMLWGAAQLALGSADCQFCGIEGVECQPWFSYSRCEGCGSPQGGDRHCATALIDTE